MGLIALGALAIRVYVEWNALDAWAPNVAVGWFTLALTILVVQRIVEREARQRIQPRIDRALDVLSREFGLFAWETYWDYTTTHLKEDPLPELPSDPLAVFDLWVEGVDTVDFPPPTKNGRSLFLERGVEFVERVQRVADFDREHLPPDLVVAIDNLIVTFTGASFADLADEAAEAGRPGRDTWVLLVLIDSARAFGEVLRRRSGSRSLAPWAPS